MKNKKLFAILTLVCFMFTLMPVAAFAAEADTSYIAAQKGNHTVGVSDVVKFDTVLKDNANKAEATGATAEVYIYATDAAGTVSSALDMGTLSVTEPIPNVYKLTVTQGQVLDLSFARAGQYTVHAGLSKLAANETVKSVSDINLFKVANVITVTTQSPNPAYYNMALSGAVTATATTPGDFTVTAATAGFNSDNEVLLTPNGVATDEIFAKLTIAGNDLAGKTVAISTNSSSIEVNKETATTNSLGMIDFTVSASVEGDYEIDLTVDGETWTLKVQVGNTSAAYIALKDQPTAPQAQFGTMNNEKVTFEITDINGNVFTNGQGMTGIANNDQAGQYYGKYIVLTEKPAASTLKSEHLTLTDADNDGEWELNGVNKDAEGTYAVKVILDNGAFATATWEVKKFQTPVEIVIDAPATVELGTNIDVELSYVDVNGVEKDATDAELAATGYAISYLDKANKKVYVKTDEKYAGQAITLTAVSDKYDLVSTKTVTVAGEAVAIEFEDKSLEVNVNNKVEWNVVDAEGNAVTLSDIAGYEIKYVVLDKPEGAKVSVTDRTVNFDGEGLMALTSNKVGNVAVQVIAQVEVERTTAAANGTSTSEVQTKYYTGTQIFAVGTEGKGDVVVMSIGSNEIVKNDKVATMIAAPIVQNDRTFVPFRALAEAFGAEVAWDEATQAVTAELNGVTVVMTIGSVEYTINGEAATMDVAPFLGNDSTMVPVRFVAQAFGIKVIPTYDENGATADILFNL